MTISHEFDNIRLSLGGFYKPIMTFFWGQNHKMGEPNFFLESKEQAAIANAALPGTLNPKLASPLSTYSLDLDFLPRHLKPSPSIPSGPPPPPPPISAFGRRHLVTGSHHFSFSLV